MLRPCIVAGADATTLIDEVVETMSLNGALAPFQRMLQSLPVVAPVLPDPGVPIQLVHNDDVATAVRAAALGRGAPGVYNLAAEETLTTADIADALGWRSLPVPSLAVDAATSVLDQRAADARARRVDQRVLGPRRDGHLARPRPARLGARSTAPTRRSTRPSRRRAPPASV